MSVSEIDEQYLLLLLRFGLVNLDDPKDINAQELNNRLSLTLDLQAQEQEQEDEELQRILAATAIGVPEERNPTRRPVGQTHGEPRPRTSHRRGPEQQDQQRQRRPPQAQIGSPVVNRP
jgi:hypothetical protein